MLELINDVLDLPDTVATQYKIRDGEIHIYMKVFTINALVEFAAKRLVLMGTALNKKYVTFQFWVNHVMSL